MFGALIFASFFLIGCGSGPSPKEKAEIIKEYYKKVEKEERIIPNVKGMDGMDAVALLENLGLKVKVIGVGRVKKQSLTSGQAFNKNQTIIIELS